ncbi:SHOCT domain-containing protein [Diaminobutyricibacter tongyongensis]|uniref:SHOCT domain-containing protein n=1 Tax=Leifsonia tongyongensis TaxID=1268043 RepID=A0A6L9Y3L0_9MICO|nr:SHOCT domain-containing protein [Diaminobutyricibacter tongyongensis]NEN07814.1 SHOCT domain-containing protein [Diaminobutyricibacter tongyongensis]
MSESRSESSIGRASLVWFSLAAIVGGGILAIAMNSRRVFDQNVADLGATLSGGFYDDAQAVTDTVWMWVGIGIALAGVLTLIIFIAVRAGTSRAQGAVPERPMLKQRMREREHEEGPAHTRAASMSEELANLADLHAKGVLSDAEFEAAKAKTLGTTS